MTEFFKQIVAAGKNLTGLGWVCVVLSTAVAGVISMGKFSGTEIMIPAAIGAGITAIAAAGKTRKN